MYRVTLGFLISCVLSLSFLVAEKESGSGKDDQVPDIAWTDIAPEAVSWEPVSSSYEQIALRVSGPDGFLRDLVFEAGEAITFGLVDESGSPLADGSYNYELTLTPTVNEGLRALMSAYVDSGDQEILDELNKALPEDSHRQSGHFRILGGSAVVSDQSETDGGSLYRRTGPDNNGIRADQVILDDLIVDGSICAGLDCVNGESFGFDTIRLKENNLRIKAQDTSNSASFPTRDWQITFNESSNGGANKFSIDDIDGGRTPFTIEAGAPSHSLYVDDGGRLGLGTSTPVVDIHAKSGNTPTLRLEQDGSSGFNPQTWDVAGNEANFFIRDVTNGSTLPIRLRPGAPTSTIDIAGSGNIGIGHASPDVLFHVKGNDSATGSNQNDQIRAENNSGTNGIRRMMSLVNNGETRLSLTDTSGATQAGGDQWNLETDSTGPAFIITLNGSGTQEARLLDGGDMIIGGMLMENSSREVKENFHEVDVDEVLAKISAIPLSTWNFKKNPDGVRHMGPMAQDFRASFGLGRDDAMISTYDVAGANMAAIQSLVKLVDAKDAKIADLEARLAALEELIKK